MSETFGGTPRDVEIINLPDEMRTSFLDYAMSVIVARALPDVRDGLKPVHRRILYGMNELGVTPDKPHKKSARIVGDVMGKYHPHGDSAIYEAMVRMAQPFSYRQMLVDGHGNYGSVDGDGAAAMRYTEARMSKIALEMLKDINKDTVDFQENYSQEETEPVVLPARFPNLLVNGASGIAVGMATNIPPHNLGEVIDALILLMKDPDVTISEIMEVLPGPDFPTGGIVLGKSGIRKAYQTGKGKIIVRSKVEIEPIGKDRERIVITEIPYGANKAKIVERIAELARDKKIEGITYVADESGREGMRIVIEVRRDMSASIVVNNLFKYTALQSTFGMNMLAIDKGIPKILGLKDILSKYLEHQVEVIRRRTAFERRKAEERAHILEGLRIALDVIDEIIAIIRSSQEADTARNTLIERFDLTSIQAQAILDMRLVRLTGLEREKIEQEYQDLLALISRLNEILSSELRIFEIIEDELTDIKNRYNDERRTQLMVGELTDIDDEDLIEEEESLIVLTKNGYIKRMVEDEFQVQNRGGRGVKGMGVSQDDSIQMMLSCSTHDVLLYFTNLGKVYQTKGYEVPEYGRTAKGIPIINLLNLDKDEEVRDIVRVNPENQENINEFLMFVTKKGIVKRSKASNYFNIRKNGLIAIKLNDDDKLINVLVTDDSKNIIIGTRKGYAATFKEMDVRPMGRTATGVRGIRLREDDFVIGAAILNEDDEVLVVSEKGFGKRTDASEYVVKNRGGKGVRTLKITDKNGELAGITTTDGSEDLMIMTDQGTVIRFNIASISKTGRQALGVRMIRLTDDALVRSITKIEHSEDEEIAEIPEPDEDDLLDDSLEFDDDEDMDDDDFDDEDLDEEFDENFQEEDEDE